MRRLEFDDLSELDHYLVGNSDLTGAVFQSLDLTRHTTILSRTRLDGAVFLGCRFSERLRPVLDRSNALVFPSISGLPFQPFRNQLYAPDELFKGYETGDEFSYERTLDGRIYKHFKTSGGAESSDIFELLARRLHDHAVSDALDEFISGKKVIAVMGGHSMRRDDPMYLSVARLSQRLTRDGFLMTSGGGPGAMEATHLGAWFCERTDSELEEAVRLLSRAPLYKPKGAWLDTTLEVAVKYPVTSRDRCASLGVPTWLYGHEPPTFFALHIAKYFANSVREEGLLAIAKSGVVFSPGSAGTIQEIFQDATQNHYESFGGVSPMIFLGREYWNERKPVFPLLEQLAEGYPYSQWLSITDSIDDIVSRLQRYDASSK